MMSDPLEKLLTNMDQPRQPRPEFADALLDRLLAELTPHIDTERTPQLRQQQQKQEDEMIHATASSAPLPRLPLHGDKIRPFAAASRQAQPGRFRTHLATAALLLLALAAAFLTMGPQRGTEGDDPPLHLAAVATPDIEGTPGPASPVKFIWQTRGGPDLPLSGAGLLTIDPQGNLWVPNPDTHQFQIFSPDGAFLEAWGTEGNGDSQFNLVASGYGFGAVAFDAEGNLYVADTGNRRIQKFNADRQFITSWGTQGANEGQFLRPLALAIDGDGRVFVADDLRADIQVFDSDGVYLATWGGRESGDERLNGPSGLTVDAGGNLWVADYSNNRIVQFSPDGSFLTRWGTYGSDAGELFEPSSLAVDDQGRVYVAEFGNYRVQVFDSEGRVLTTWGESGRGEGQFDGVYGIVLDHDGNVYVSDVFAQRVQKFRLLPPLAP